MISFWEKKQNEVIQIPTIKGPMTFKKGKDLPDEFKESLKKENINHLPFAMKEQKQKKKKKTVKKKKKTSLF